MGSTQIVIKRDGTTCDFNEDKIVQAVNKATAAVRETVFIEAEMEQLLSCFHTLREQKAEFPLLVETVQDLVEEALMSLPDARDVSRAYILYRQNKKVEREVHHGYDVRKIPDDVDVPWGPIGYITYKRTYARLKDPESGSTETENFRDTILRVLDASQKQLNVGFNDQELKDAYKYMMQLKGLPSGRFLWQLGTTTVDRHGLMSLQNCAFVRVDEPIKPFTWIFDVLMLGTGVGVSVEHKHISKLPPVLSPQAKTTAITVTRQDTKDADFIVPDSRSGWVSLLQRTLTAFFIDGKSFTYSTILIRNKGTPIRGFGGTASGPEDLCTGIANIVKILQSRANEHLSSVNCLDVINIIGSIVVAGNIRRSAIIALGDADDIEYMQAKRWDLGGIPNWRAMSNNSVVCDDTSILPEEFWEGYKGLGEPYGLINTTLSREIGRLQDGDMYPDSTAEGTNPCGEQTLCNYETCCLSEIFLPNIDTYHELCKVAIMLYRICKHSLALPCHHPQTEEIVHQNSRMGIGVTGYLQATDEQRGWLDALYEHLRAYDNDYSASHAFPTSIKLTTTKPSGTLSLLPNVTPGVHPAIFLHYIRRIRINTSNPLVDLCRAHGYHVEFQIGFDGQQDQNTSVVSFPCKYPDGTVLGKDLKAVDQLRHVMRLQNEWSDNGVSCTVYYRLHELDEIRAFLNEHYATKLKGCSFLLHNDHGFAQAPYEEISQEEYETMIATCTPITSGVIEQEDDSSTECLTGACPVK